MSDLWFKPIKLSWFYLYWSKIMPKIKFLFKVFSATNN